MASGPDGDGDEPEPKEDEDLLIDDVHSKDTETVVFLDRSGVTIFVEGAFGNLKQKSIVV